MANAILIDEIISNALNEDLGFGDVTTECIIPVSDKCRAKIFAKASGVISGVEIAKRVFEKVDNDLKYEAKAHDGEFLNKGDIIAFVEGNVHSLLMGERVALNFMQRMSGIATAAHEFAEAVKGTGAMIVDTRKTVPGLRVLDKYAVKCGGARNHRMNLSDGVMIKDNHIDAAGGITKAVTMVREHIGHTLKIEVEVKNMDEVKEAVECKVDIIMLDNMNVEECREAVNFINKRAIVEASGNVDVEKAVQLAQAGVDVISIGGLTHSVKAMDISMRMA